MPDSITKNSVEKTITIKNGKEVVRSDKLALMFEKQHKDILKIIRVKRDFLSGEKIPPKDFFIEDIGKTIKGREYTRFYLTRKGFDFVGLSLQGKKADLYKVWYINAFHDKQRVIEEHNLTMKLNKQDDLWVQFRKEGIEFRNKLTKSIQDTIVKYREEQESKFNDGKYYYHYTTLIYSILGIDLPKGTNPRDVLDKRTLVRLEDLEDRVAGLIVENHENGIYYKESYKIIKGQLK